MDKTLLLVFIHGFKGDDNTFANFPAHICALLSNALPNLNITTAVYPKYDTRGELNECVQRFRDWLTNQVIDLEVGLGTPSPTVEPGVRVVIIGHSMGGIVGAEAILGIVGEDTVGHMEREYIEEEEVEKVVAEENDAAEPASPTFARPRSGGSERARGGELGSKSTLMFPCIQGLLAFDTPYLGISPGVIAHGAEDHWRTGKTFYQSAAGLFAGGAAAKGLSSEKTDSSSTRPLSLPPAAPASQDDAQPQAPKTAWQRWGKTALIASAGAAAAAAAGATAYVKRSEISSFTSGSVSWVSSHLEFVGCLARAEDLKKRLAAMATLTKTHGIGFADVYTSLGQTVQSKRRSLSPDMWDGKVGGTERTFCNLPRSGLKRYFVEARNDKIEDEVTAHMMMFVPKENPGYYSMSDEARELIVSWISKDWYEPPTKDEETLNAEAPDPT